MKTFDTPFLFIQGDQKTFHDASRRLLTGMQEENVISQLFFHPRNVEHVNKMVAKNVYRVSGGDYIIEDQNVDDLIIVMRGVFESYARHDPTLDLKIQLKELNNIVIEEVTPGIISEIKAKIGYEKKLFEPRSIMDYGTNTGVRGNKTLSLFRNNK